MYNSYRPVPGWALLLFLAALAVFGVALRLFVGPDLMELGMLGILGAFYAVMLCAVVVSIAPLRTAAFPALGVRGAGWKPVVFGAIGTLVLSVAVSKIGPEVKGMQAVEELVREPRAFLSSLLLLGLLAPVVEELIFRGLLYGWIAGRWGTIPAWLVSSIAFAIAHYEPAHILLVLPLGLLFGYLRRRTDSLLPSTVAHIVNNSFAVLAAAYVDG
ncbi:CAAX protease self-immunity [Enhydrobacter aerosaccus]|uniref:CAAX protease self-immunity n=2 Tax=Enhydrobacter aerosaccus TaxID=225324 RepID=A0A1T4SH74_9HYPH|nr:CAAX protease self-immunity [Enhydrobacter aerosaccus]